MKLLIILVSLALGCLARPVSENEIDGKVLVWFAYNDDTDDDPGYDQGLGLYSIGLKGKCLKKAMDFYLKCVKTGSVALCGLQKAAYFVECLAGLHPDSTTTEKPNTKKTKKPKMTTKKPNKTTKEPNETTEGPNETKEGPNETKEEPGAEYDDDNEYEYNTEDLV